MMTPYHQQLYDDIVNILCVLVHISDWSLITGRGGGYKTGEGGGVCEVLPLQTKRGAEKVLAILKGGGPQKVLGSFYLVAWRFSHFEGGGAQKFPLFKTKTFTLSWGGGGRKRFRTCNFPIL